MDDNPTPPTDEALDQTLAALETAYTRIATMSLVEIDDTVSAGPYVFGHATEKLDHFTDSFRALRFLRDVFRAQKARRGGRR